MLALVERHAVDTARGSACFHCVDQQNAICFFNIGKNVEKGRTRFDHRDTGRKIALREGAGDVYAHTLIAEQQIAYTEN